MADMVMGSLAPDIKSSKKNNAISNAKYEVRFSYPSTWGSQLRRETRKGKLREIDGHKKGERNCGRFYKELETASVQSQCWIFHFSSLWDGLSVGKSTQKDLKGLYHCYTWHVVNGEQTLEITTIIPIVLKIKLL